MKKQQIKYILVLDAETSGMFYNQQDPSFHAILKKEHQSVSWGFIVADAQTFKPIDKLYLEIKWNGDSEWNMKAQEIHGLSKEYLDKHGISEEEAVEKIGQFLEPYWGPMTSKISDGIDYTVFPLSSINCLGVNIASFDLFFLRRLFKRVFGDNFYLHLNSRQFDLNSIAFCAMNIMSSDEIFETLEFPPRQKHNALEDAEMTLKAARLFKKMWNMQ